MIGSTYGYFAINDLKYLRLSVHPFNATCLSCHEVVEKLFKHILDIEFESDEATTKLLHSNNLLSLVRKIREKYDVDIESFRGISTLNDFWFTGRCPTDTPFIATTKDINKCIDCVNDVIGWFFSTVTLETVFDLYCDVTGLKDDPDRFHDDKDSRRMLMDLCGAGKVPKLPEN